MIDTTMFTNNWNAIYKNGSYVRCGYKFSKKLSTSAILLNLNIENWRF